MTKTVHEVIEAIISAIPGAPFPKTVDTLKTGQPDQVVTGIALTFLANYDVIQQAIRCGANFIITHEPTYYNHRDETTWLKDDPVYQAKRRLIEENRIAIWRFHDNLHALQPDPTVTGLLKILNWTEFALPNKPLVCQLPARSLRNLTGELKAALGVATVRVVGDLEMECKTVAFLVGATGGEAHIQMLADPNVEVLICGEIHEWETSEYVRDARLLGLHKALVVVGHAASEEAGIREVLPWLQQRLPQTKITFIPAKHPFQWL